MVVAPIVKRTHTGEIASQKNRPLGNIPYRKTPVADQIAKSSLAARLVQLPRNRIGGQPRRRIAGESIRQLAVIVKNTIPGADTPFERYGIPSGNQSRATPQRRLRSAPNPSFVVPGDRPRIEIEYTGDV